MTAHWLRLIAASVLIGTCAASLLALRQAARASDATSATKPIFKNGAKSTDWIDFEFYRESQILVPVKVNGQPAAARLVIGASSAVDAGFAASLGLRPQNLAAPSEGGHTAADMIRDVELEVGGLTVPGSSMRVKDLATQSTKSGHPYSVFLSDDLLKDVVVDIDFPNRRLALRDSKTMTKPAGAEALPLAKVGIGYSVPASVENAKLVLFHIEFANGAPLMVTRPYAQSQGFLDGRRVSQRYTGPTKEPEGMITLNNLHFAGIKYRQMPAVVVPNSLFDPAWFDAEQLSGVVGMPLLARYRLIFDFPRDRLYALTDAKTTTQPFDKDRLGATLLNGEVTFVAPNSPAQLNGIKQGDKIALINGKPPEALSDTETVALYHAPVGTTVTFSMSGGEAHQVNLAEYY